MADQDLPISRTGDGDYWICGCCVHHIAKPRKPMTRFCNHVPHRIRYILICKERNRHPIIRHIYATEEESKLSAAWTSCLVMSGYSWSI